MLFRKKTNVPATASSPASKAPGKAPDWLYDSIQTLAADVDREAAEAIRHTLLAFKHLPLRWRILDALYETELGIAPFNLQRAILIELIGEFAWKQVVTADNERDEPVTNEMLQSRFRAVTEILRAPSDARVTVTLNPEPERRTCDLNDGLDEDAVYQFCIEALFAPWEIETVFHACGLFDSLDHADCRERLALIADVLRADAETGVAVAIAVARPTRVRRRRSWR